MSEDITLWSTTRQAAAIRAGEVGCRALLELVIARIERIDPTLNAVVTRDFARAREAADAADAALARGDAVGPLHGVPITIKDALETAGLRSTGGAVELRDNVPAHDAPAVRAVRDAGAIVIGKTNLPRWSGDAQSFNAMFGTTCNPWDATRVPGGSSGGAAAAVATGMTSFEIGTDIGGSIRIPSAYCGVFGHKPSFGIVPSTGYLDHEQGGTTEADINVLGPIARSAEDLELLLGLLLRRDGALVPQLLPPPEDVRTLRVAAWLDDPFCPVDTESLAVLEAAAAALAASGVTVDRRARPDIDPAQASGLGMFLVTSAMLQSAPEETARVGGTTSATTHRAWLDAHRAREAIRARWAAFFTHYDAVLMPVAFVPAFTHAQDGDFGSRTLPCNGQVRPYADLVRWTILTGMAYLPATVPPIGRTAANLPVGMQVVGPWGGDWRTLRLAAHIAQLTGGYVPPSLTGGQAPPSNA
jgi:amidase